VPAAAAWKAAQINANAKTKTKHISNAKPNTSTSTSTSIETSADTNSKSHISTKWGNIISADTDQTMGDCPTTQTKDGGQPSPSPDDRLKHGSQMSNFEER
jgi:hypothetical protein